MHSAQHRTDDSTAVNASLAVSHTQLIKSVAQRVEAAITERWVAKHALPPAFVPCALVFEFCVHASTTLQSCKQCATDKNTQPSSLLVRQHSRCWMYTRSELQYRQSCSSPHVGNANNSRRWIGIPSRKHVPVHRKLACSLTWRSNVIPVARAARSLVARPSVTRTRLELCSYSVEFRVRGRPPLTA